MAELGVYTPIYLGAGKHPSPLEKPKTISTNDYLTVGFYRIKKYCSDQKLLRFKDCSTRTSVTSCQPPIYRYFQRVHLGAGKHPSPLEKKKKKKKKIVLITTLQEVFELSKNIVPVKSYTSFLASPYY